MKKFFLLLLLIISVAASSQIKISQLPTHTGDPAGGYVPISIGPITKKIDARYFGYAKLDSVIFRNDSLFAYKNGVSSLVGKVGGDGNNYVSFFAFDSTTGDFAVGRNGMSAIVTNLDGRYLLKNALKNIYNSDGSFPEGTTRTINGKLGILNIDSVYAFQINPNFGNSMTVAPTYYSFLAQNTPTSATRYSTWYGNTVTGGGGNFAVSSRGVTTLRFDSSIKLNPLDSFYVNSLYRRTRTSDRFVVYDTITHSFGYGDFTALSQTFQDVLTSSSNLSTNNSINGGGYTLSFNNNYTLYGKGTHDVNFEASSNVDTVSGISIYPTYSELYSYNNSNIINFKVTPTTVLWNTDTVARLSDVRGLVGARTLQDVTVAGNTTNQDMIINKSNGSMSVTNTVAGVGMAKIGLDGSNNGRLILRENNGNAGVYGVIDANGLTTQTTYRLPNTGHSLDTFAVLSNVNSLIFSNAILNQTTSQTADFHISNTGRVDQFLGVGVGQFATEKLRVSGDSRFEGDLDIVGGNFYVSGANSPGLFFDNTSGVSARFMSTIGQVRIGSYSNHPVNFVANSQTILTLVPGSNTLQIPYLATTAPPPVISANSPVKPLSIDANGNVFSNYDFWPSYRDSINGQFAFELDQMMYAAYDPLDSNKLDTLGVYFVRDNPYGGIIDSAEYAKLMSSFSSGANTLTANTTFTSSVASYRITYSGISTSSEGPQFSVVTTGINGTAIKGEGDLEGVYGLTDIGYGVHGKATGSGGYGANFESDGGTSIKAFSGASAILEGTADIGTTNSVHEMFALSRTTSGTAANGLGQSISFYLESSTGSTRLANQIVSEWATATDASRVSKYSIKGVSAGTTETWLEINAGGIIRMNNGADTVASRAYARSVAGGGGGVTDHGALTGLADDDHTQYALLAGRSGGQILKGGTASGDDLTLMSTNNATKGSIFFGTSEYDEVNNRLGINVVSPSARMHMVSTSVGTTTTIANALYLQNTTAAANNSQQYSPALILEGKGWKTASTAASQAVAYSIQTQPVQAVTNPQANLVFAASINGGAYSTLVTINDQGSMTVSGSIYATSSLAANGQLSVSRTTNVPQSYRLSNGGSDQTPYIFLGDNGTVTAGTPAIAMEGKDKTNGFLFLAANGTRQIARATINIGSLTNTAGSEAGDLIFQTMTGGALSEKFRISATNSGGVISAADFKLSGTASMYINSPGAYASGLTSTLIWNNGSGRVEITPAAAYTAVTTSSAATLTLTTGGAYVFTGTTTTWTLPTTGGNNTTLTFVIKNRGSGNITLNSNSGGNDIYNTSATNTLSITPGQTVRLINDGTYYLVVN